ncbi:hypothetical protein CTAYLR_005930 [Chrysophaeum taylorii]|uniref:WW domain-containing protein n=1 Tax=Chrysophaeum taylorii TaxID=2483200 RepID=A0AAD7UCE7_9STRA|nr:hypothetical protein CTAYLR_005930 [Chrysophaeum taylorii]
MSRSSARRARLEVAKHMEDMMDRLCARHSIIDLGDWSAFPLEGMCWLRVKCLDEEDERVVLWPAWLLARGTESWSGPIVVRDDWTRVVCCYGAGWTVEVQIFELMPYDDPEALDWLKSRRGGGRLYRSALAEATARVTLAKKPCEVANFQELASQNLDLCQAPVLLGRVWRAHESRVARRPKPGEVLAVRWNDSDWWPSTVERVGASVAGAAKSDAIEVVYDDDAKTRETIVRGSAVWHNDVRCLGDDTQPLHDDKDVELLQGTEFMLSEEPPEEEEKSSKKKKKGKSSSSSSSSSSPRGETVLVDATEEPDKDVPEEEDEAYEPEAGGERKDDHELEDAERDEDEPAPAEPEPDDALPQPPPKHQPKKKKKKQKPAPSATKRKQLLKVAKGRWNVSSRLVNSGGVKLALPSRLTDPVGDREDPADASGLERLAPESSSSSSSPPPNRASKKKAAAPNMMRSHRAPAAAPSVLSLLLGGPKKKASATPLPGAAKKDDNAAAVAAVELSLAASREREARLLTLATQPPQPEEEEEEEEEPPPSPPPMEDDDALAALPPVEEEASPVPVEEEASPVPVEEEAPPVPPVEEEAPPVPSVEVPRVPEVEEDMRPTEEEIPSAAPTTTAEEEMPAAPPVEKEDAPPAAPRPTQATSSSEDPPKAPKVPPKPPLLASKAASRLPPGWVAKWSDRKKMYYYAHKAKQLTRWTPPKFDDEKTESVDALTARASVPRRDSAKHARDTTAARSPTIGAKRPHEASSAQDYAAPVEYQPPGARYAPPPRALDAARRTMAAIEATITIPSGQAGPPAPSYYAQQQQQQQQPATTPSYYAQQQGAGFNAPRPQHRGYSYANHQHHQPGGGMYARPQTAYGGNAPASRGAPRPPRGAFYAYPAGNQQAPRPGVPQGGQWWQSSS